MSEVVTMAKAKSVKETWKLYKGDVGVTLSEDVTIWVRNTKLEGVSGDKGSAKPVVGMTKRTAASAVNFGTKEKAFQFYDRLLTDGKTMYGTFPAQPQRIIDIVDVDGTVYRIARKSVADTKLLKASVGEVVAATAAGKCGVLG